MILELKIQPAAPVAVALLLTWSCWQRSAVHWNGLAHGSRPWAGCLQMDLHPFSPHKVASTSINPCRNLSSNSYPSQVNPQIKDIKVNWDVDDVEYCRIRSGIQRLDTSVRGIWLKLASFVSSFWWSFQHHGPSDKGPEGYEGHESHCGQEEHAGQDQHEAHEGPLMKNPVKTMKVSKCHDKGSPPWRVGQCNWVQEIGNLQCPEQFGWDWHKRGEEVWQVQSSRAVSDHCNALEPNHDWGSPQSLGVEAEAEASEGKSSGIGKNDSFRTRIPGSFEGGKCRISLSHGAARQF